MLKKYSKIVLNNSPNLSAYTRMQSYQSFNDAAKTFETTLRDLLLNKIYSAINIAGLSLGLVQC